MPHHPCTGLTMYTCHQERPTPHPPSHGQASTKVMAIIGLALGLQKKGTTAQRIQTVPPPCTPAITLGDRISGSAILPGRAPAAKQSIPGRKKGKYISSTRNLDYEIPLKDILPTWRLIGPVFITLSSGHAIPVIIKLPPTPVASFHRPTSPLISTAKNSLIQLNILNGSPGFLLSFSSVHPQRGELGACLVLNLFLSCPWNGLCE